MPRCPDCRVDAGQPHHPECDLARCPVCGIQRRSCTQHHGAEVFSYWTGRWPGEAECERLGYWVRLAPGEGWMSCDRDHPGATHDLNRLYREAARGLLRWDTGRQEFVATADQPA
ncbi:hypothetical protein AB0K21_21910 [Streptosporangium sp. NPDC049248]|uniref:hypothetical protein n=1 Tax=Streptosporangium sp. NPDC049248 TaxID=3155651 RepID=UPI00342A594B